MTTKESNAGNSQEETIVTTPENPDQETKLGEVIDPSDDKGDVDTPPGNGQGDEQKVPLHVVIDMKKEIRELKRQLSEKSITTKDFDDEVTALQDKFNVDGEFIEEMLSVAEKRAEQRLAPKIQQISQKEQAQKVAQALDNLYENSIQANPEYADIANKDVIMELAKNPANKGKTMSQILEETYGRVVQKGTRTLEKTTPGASKDTDYDFDNMDSEQEREVLNDPELSKKYAEHNMKYIKNLL